MFSPTTITLTADSHPIHLHLFSTGMVADKSKLRNPRWKNPFAAIDAIIDPHFTEWLPIWVMAIDHPEGLFLIDTGERAAVTDKNYFKSEGPLANWYCTTQYKFAVQRDDEIDRQLEAKKIPLKNIRSIILTHLHFDHTDGLYHFPNTPVFVNRQEAEHPSGTLPTLYPKWFRPTLLDLKTPYGPFQKTQSLTTQDNLLLIHTPGHTHGHCSVLIRTDITDILFAGDVCYSETDVKTENFATNLASRRQAKKTYTAIKQYARQRPLILLPSHDPDAAQRLKALKTL